jgi:transcriptional regulator with XRE-family HTH domain
MKTIPNLPEKGLGGLLRDWRMTNKVRQQDVAEEVGCSRSTISFFERAIYDNESGYEQEIKTFMAKRGLL